MLSGPGLGQPSSSRRPTRSRRSSAPHGPPLFRSKQQNALDRVAAALEPLDDDDDDLDMSDDELDGDFDDFNPRSEEAESLI